MKGALRHPAQPSLVRIVARRATLASGDVLASTVTRGRPIRFAGRGLIVEVSPVSFPNRSAVLRGSPQVEAPGVIQLKARDY